MKKIDVVLITVVSILVIMIGYWYFDDTQLQKEQEHDSYCKNWSESLEQQLEFLKIESENLKSGVEGGHISPQEMQSFYNEMSAPMIQEASDYNKECYY